MMVHVLSLFPSVVNVISKKWNEFMSINMWRERYLYIDLLLEEGNLYLQ